MYSLERRCNVFIDRYDALSVVRPESVPDSRLHLQTDECCPLFLFGPLVRAEDDEPGVVVLG